MRIRSLLLVAAVSTFAVLPIEGAGKQTSQERDRLVATTTVLRSKTHEIYIENRQAGNDTVERSHSTARMDGARILDVDTTTIASPYTVKCRLCFSQHPALPCLEVEQSFPEVQGETTTESFSLVDRETVALLVVRLEEETLYTGSLNTHYEDLGVTSAITLEIPEKLRGWLLSEFQEEEPNRTRMLLALLRKLYDHAERTVGANASFESIHAAYGKLPMVHGSVALEVGWSLMSSLFGDSPPDPDLRNVVAEDFQVMVEPLIIERMPPSFLEPVSESE